MNVQQNKTMSVRDMGRLLGLKKVESYWLVHKGYFEAILVNGKMRVVTESFEHWYAGQIKYHKVTGEAPGKRLKQESYSAKDIGEILQISESFAYELMKAAGVKPILVDYWQRFPEEAFDEWYMHQTRYRNQTDRERDAEIEENSISLPEMARILNVSRHIVYGILGSKLGKEMLEVVIVGDRKRVTKESFDRWYYSQSTYFKPEDRPEGYPKKRQSYADSLTKKKVKTPSGPREVRHSENPDYLTVDEAALLTKTDTAQIHRWIRADKFPVLRISRKVIRIPAADFDKFLLSIQQQSKGE